MNWNWLNVIQLVQAVLAWLQQMEANGDFTEIESAIQAAIQEIQTVEGQAVVTKVQAMVPPKAPVVPPTA
jgi:hypothetical protein